MNTRSKSSPSKAPGIFISYRRSDTPDATGRIYDRLVSEFGKSRVFKDVDSIPLGQDFRGHLNEVVGGCAAVLAIIGPHWVDARNGAGQRRLEDADDFVRIELEATLSRGIPVVPVLVAHATMPGAADLPASLASMVFRQSIEVRPDPDFHNDATRLVSALRGILDPNAPPTQAASATNASPGRPSRWVIAFCAATLLAAALAVPALKQLRETPPSEIRTEISVPAQDTNVPALALSPDGKQIVFSAPTGGVAHLWLRPLAGTVAQPIPGTEGATLPFWSPDSRSIGFFTANAMKRVDVGGGAPLMLAPVSTGVGGSWNAEGIILFSQGPGQPLGRIAASGGAITEVTHLGFDAVAHLFPTFLPDGHRFVYLAQGGKAPGVYLGSLEGTAPVLLLHANGPTAVLPSGWLLVWDATRHALLAQRLDVDRSAMVGAPLTLAEGSIGMVSASATGLLAYWQGALSNGKHRLLWRSRTGAELGTLGAANESYGSARISPDGRRVAAVRTEADKDDIWLLDGERTNRVTFDPASSDFPVWTPDGASIVFASARPSAPGLYQKPADGGEEEQLLLRYEGVIAPSSWSPDGRYLMYVLINSETRFDSGVLPTGADRKPWKFLNTPSVEGAGEISPDGKWAAYQSNQSARSEVYIRPFIGPGAAKSGQSGRTGQWQVSLEGGSYPKWSADGKELFFLNPLGEMMAAPITFAGSVLSSGTPVKLFQTRIVGGGRNDTGGPEYDVAPDGRFLINTIMDELAAATPPIILIQNWNPVATAP